MGIAIEVLDDVQVHGGSGDHDGFLLWVVLVDFDGYDDVPGGLRAVLATDTGSSLSWTDSWNADLRVVLLGCFER